MTPGELAEWVRLNRKALRRVEQWACRNPDCTRTQVIAVRYADGSGQQVLWTPGRRRIKADGELSTSWAVPLRAGGQAVLVDARCSHCGRASVLRVDGTAVSAVLRPF